MRSYKTRLLRWVAIPPVALVAAASSVHAQEEFYSIAQPVYETFAPNDRTIKHRIDYAVWTSALSNFVVSMGPPLRKRPFEPPSKLGTRQRLGHNSIYRLDGAMVAFSFMNDDVRASFTEYRQDLERVADTLDIQSIPRNEQLAFWFNLHNVAMVEQIAYAWPIRQPHEIMIDGVTLDEAKFITVEGIALSPRDIREKIVYSHWKNPKVIYGFWRGVIGGPAMQREAFEGPRVSDQLDRAAREFANSRRGTEKRGGTLHVSTLYEEAAPYFFTNFEHDLRSHLRQYVERDVVRMVEETSTTKATLRERDIADLSGGARANPFFSDGRLGVGIAALLYQRAKKFEYVERKGLRTGRVIFSNIDLPGDPEDKGVVE